MNETDNKNFMHYGVLPFVVSGLVFTLLTTFLPKQYHIWLGLLVSFSISMIVYSLSAALGTRDEILRAHSNLQAEFADFKLRMAEGARVFRTYPEIMAKATSMIGNTENKLVNVYIYQAYPISKNREDEYFTATLKAIEEGQIDRYHRIMAVRNSEEAEAVIAVLKVLSKSEIARKQTRFWVAYQPAESFLSFLSVGELECLVAFPDLSDAPPFYTGQRCGIYVRDNRVSHTLKDLLRHIRDNHEYTELLAIPPPSYQEEQWESLGKSIADRAISVRGTRHGIPSASEPSSDPPESSDARQRVVAGSL